MWVGRRIGDLTIKVDIKCLKMEYQQTFVLLLFSGWISQKLEAWDGIIEFLRRVDGRRDGLVVHQSYPPVIKGWLESPHWPMVSQRNQLQAGGPFWRRLAIASREKMPKNVGNLEQICGKHHRTTILETPFTGNGITENFLAMDPRSHPTKLSSEIASKQTTKTGYRLAINVHSHKKISPISMYNQYHGLHIPLQ